MKKLIVLMVVLVASTMIEVRAATMHAFYNPSTLARAKAGQMSDAEIREAFVALFSGVNESRWWNNISTCSYAQMRAIYANHLAELFKLPELPSSEAMVALVNASELVPAPAMVNTAGIKIGTAQVERFSRPAYVNEKMFVSNGVAWASGGCGNLGGNVLREPEPIPVREEFDRSPQKNPVILACDGCESQRTRQEVDVRQNMNGNGGGLSASDMMLMMMMANQQRQAPQQEVVVKNKANAWEVIAGITGVVNVGLNVWDLARESRMNRYYTTQQYSAPIPQYPQWSGSYPVVQPQPVWNRPHYPQRPPQRDYPRTPRQPDRVWPDYDRGTWYENRPPVVRPPVPRGWDQQGASGDYRLATVNRYDNTNASGLGVGQGYGSYGGSYNDPYYDQRNNPLQDNGRGNARDTRTGRDYTYDPRYVW